MSRSIILIILFLNSFISSAQNNCEVVWPSGPINTGSNATYLITAGTEVTFNGEPFINGKIGAFYSDDNGNLQNGGWVTWNNSPMNFAVWGDDSSTPEIDGFASGEEITWLATMDDGQTTYQASVTYTMGPAGMGSSNYVTNGINIFSEITIINSVFDACNIDVLGCTDSLYFEYNPIANLDDGSCQNLVVEGCLNSDYLEYNPLANSDDGSCNDLKIYGCMDPLFLQYNPLANYDNGSCEILIRDALSELISEYQNLYDFSDSVISELELNTESWNHNITLQEGWNLFGYGCPVPIDLVLGLSNHTDLIQIVKENNGAVYMPIYNFNAIGNLIPGLGYQINVFETIEDFRLCDWYIDNMFDYDINNIDLDLSSIQSDLDCYENPENCNSGSDVLGCMNEFALNYNSLVSVDDGSCVLIGCSDPTYLEYYTQGFIPSSNDQAYDDLFCNDIAEFGCMDSSACNYNPDANMADGSCEYPGLGYDCEENPLNSSFISDCDDFVDGPNSYWPYVLEATTFADSTVSQESQTFYINVSSLPANGAYFRVYKTVANGNDYFGNPVALNLGLNSFTVSAVIFDREVKFQFSSGDIEFIALSLNGEDSDCVDPLPTPSSTLIRDCFDFVSGPSSWPYMLEATTIANSSVSQGSQTYTMNVTSLPEGGANVRVYKTTANGNDFFGNAVALTLGENTITLEPVDFDRTVKFQFSSGDVRFDALNLNGVDSDCVTNIQNEVSQYQIGEFAEGGIIFYVDSTGERGLVAAMEDLTEGATDPYGLGFNGYEWGCYGQGVNGADGTYIGTGYQNTMDIVNQGCATQNGGKTAAQAALDAELNGYSDWFLPSKDELAEMYYTIGNGGPEGNIGGFDTSGGLYTSYWSSSSANIHSSIHFNFSFGSVFGGDVDRAFRVRVIRLFGNWTMGCMDPNACNYNPEANMADGSCEYAQGGFDCEGNQLLNLEIGQEYAGGTIFQINQDGTGLVVNQVNLNEMNWFDAMNTAENSTSGGYDDWFLPTTNQLHLISQIIGYYGSESFWDGFDDYNIGSDYWSSSDLNNSDGFVQGYDFAGLQEFNSSKFDSHLALFVRVFGNANVNFGCTNAESLNYNPQAIFEDFSCLVDNACPYDIFMEYSSNATNYDESQCITLIVEGCTDNNATNYYPEATLDNGACEYIYGCNDASAINYNEEAAINDGTCEYIYGCTDTSATNYNEEAVMDDESCMFIFGCTQQDAFNYNSSATSDDGSCIFYGCTDSMALNFNEIANTDDDSCIIPGCINPTAENYNEAADIDDNSCLIYGCTVSVFPNFNPEANSADGSCDMGSDDVFGCVDVNAFNYNPDATIDNGSCYNLEIGQFHAGGIIFKINEDGTGLVADIQDLGYLDPDDEIINEFSFDEAFFSVIPLLSQGYDDWYLPDVSELELMYNTIGQGSSNSIGNFVEDSYWSESLLTDLGNMRYHYTFNFSDGSLGWSPQTSQNRVRAIRSF